MTGNAPAPAPQDGWIDGCRAGHWTEPPVLGMAKQSGRNKSPPRSAPSSERLGATRAVALVTGLSAGSQPPCWSSSADTAQAMPIYHRRLVCLDLNLAGAGVRSWACSWWRRPAAAAATWWWPTKRAWLCRWARALAPDLAGGCGGGRPAAAAWQAGAKFAAGPGVESPGAMEGALPPCWPACGRTSVIGGAGFGGLRGGPPRHGGPERNAGEPASPGLECREL